VDEHITEDKHRDRLIETVAAGARVVEDRLGQDRIVEQRLDPPVERDPCARRVLIDRRTRRQLRSTGGDQERRDPLNEMPDDVSRYPPLAGGRQIPGVARHGEHAAREATGNPAVAVGDLAHRRTRPTTLPRLIARPPNTTRHIPRRAARGPTANDTSLSSRCDLVDFSGY
jgi:hypothetical protein